MYRFVYLFLIIIILIGCTHSSDTEIHQKNRTNISDVRQNVKELEIEEVMIGSNAEIYLMDNYLFIVDYRSYDKQIHIFDRNTYKYITSTAEKGEGPNEIVNIGHIAMDEVNRRFFVNDHGKQKIFNYYLDSVLINPDYTPTIKMSMNERQFPSRYKYFNDTLCIGEIIEPIGNNDFQPCMGKWNMNTGEIDKMSYNHPKIEKKRVTFDVSFQYGMYVEAYCHHDLITICNLRGELLYNIYGDKWNGTRDRLLHYGEVKFCKDKILALYSGDEFYSEKAKRYNYSTKILIFDLQGEYIKTMETGYRILHFCYDEQYNRLLMNMDDTIQFGYLDLEGII